MARRSLAFMSKGWLSISAKKALTIMSRGWLVPVVIPPPDEGGGLPPIVERPGWDGGNINKYKIWKERLMKDDEDMLLMIPQILQKCREN